jgi:hypothetical protein
MSRDAVAKITRASSTGIQSDDQSKAELRPVWVCLLVNHNFLRRRGSSVEQEMRSAFEGDFIDFAMTFDGSEETYAFVKCSDYHRHVTRLRHSPAIKTVLASFDSPCFVSESEVRDFIESANPPVRSGEFRVGDVVRVVNGCLANLAGLVVKEMGKNCYLVAFRFHIRRFRQRILAKDLTLVGNIFKMVRSPVTSEMSKRRQTPTRDVEKTGNEHRQNRTTHRKRKEANRR